jgi:hypothetical protein
VIIYIKYFELEILVLDEEKVLKRVNVAIYVTWSIFPWNHEMAKFTSEFLNTNDLWDEMSS